MKDEYNIYELNPRDNPYFTKDNSKEKHYLLAVCPICHAEPRIEVDIQDFSIVCSEDCRAPRCIHHSPRDTALSWNDWVRWYRFEYCPPSARGDYILPFEAPHNRQRKIYAFDKCIQALETLQKDFAPIFNYDPLVVDYLSWLRADYEMLNSRPIRKQYVKAVISEDLEEESTRAVVDRVYDDLHPNEKE